MAGTGWIASQIRLRLPRIRWAARKLFLRKPPKGDIYYGDVAELYDRERMRTARWRAEQAAVEGFLSELPRDLKVLDVPLDTGRFLAFYQQLGSRVTGFNSSHEMLAHAAQRAEAIGISLEIVQGDATRLPFEDSQFDLVVSTRFLRHVLPFEAAKTSLAEMARVTANHAFIELGYNERATRWPEGDKPMRDMLVHDDLVELLSRSGFRVLKRTVTQRYKYNLPFKKKRRAVFLLQKTGAPEQVSGPGTTA